MRRVRGPAALLSALAIAVSAATADARVIAGFTTPATGQSWIVPDDVTSVVVSLYGAQGGDDVDHTHGPGGLGGHTMFALTVTPGSTYQVNVGGRGGDGFLGVGPGGAGGVNGGAPGGNIAVVGRSAGGGGATDIRDGLFSLTDRIGVAGGGGGATAVVQTSVGDGGGGAGGGTTGSDGSNNLRSGDQGNPEGGKGGTQAAGGAGGPTNATYPHTGGDGLAGTFGAGGGGGDLVGGTNGDAGGGGGGGWYGGGGGGGGGTDPDGPDTFQGGGAGGGGSGHGPGGAILDSGAQTGDGAAFISAPVPSPTDLALVGSTPSSQPPTITGTAEADSTVGLYQSSSCDGPAVGSGSAAAFGTSGIAAALATDGDYTIYARAVDGGGVPSPCSATGVAFELDTTAPDAPGNLAISPQSPANQNSPTVSGTAEAGSTVEVFAHDGCTGSPKVKPTADAFALGAVVPVDDDSTTTFSVDAVDAAGNRSACATAGTYVEDSTPPPAPAGLSSSPASPSQVRAPQIKGSAQDGSMVVVYADPACKYGTNVASGTAAEFASQGLAVTVGSNSMTSFTARATDAAGNVSTCSAAFTYVEDELAPAAPDGFVLTPSSPANDNTPTLEGAAEAGSRVELWATPDCTGRMIASGTQAAFASPGFHVSVADDTTTTLYAVAIDAAGNASPCSEGVTYVEDSSSPAPSSLAVSPASPANENAPTVSGSAEPLATVRLYSTASCTDPVLGTGSAATFASPGIAISVADDTTTVVYAQATDAVGNVSPCSAGVTYVEDSTPPDAPSGLTVVPASPANDNAPVVKGLSEPGSTVRLFVSSDCGGSPVATATAATFASPGIAVTVADDSTTALRTRATDAAGNPSGCSAPVTYREDSTAPSVTLSANTTDTAPVLSGVAGTGTGDSATVTVSLYAGAVAAGTPVATLTATRDGNSGAFSVASAPLAVGTYTARAIQTDSAGNTGASAAVTFSVAGPPIEPPPATTPITPLSPTTPTTPAHPTGVPKAPALRLSQPSTHLDHGHVRLTLSCRGTSAQTCWGTIRLRSGSSKSRRGSPAFTGTSVRYSVTGGRSKELRFTLPAAVATAVRARGHLAIVVAYGPTAALRKTITVRP